ncbi:MAG: outer membrane beta-barrel protein [Candidatus Paracaedibacteraceae bacterium]|nr:outer membrane beta-barrel protein [Candidatus Paracaedibacteraceae bacterium]
MKNLVCALLTVSALTGSVFAAESKTGAYVGGNVGAANTNVKYGFVTSNAAGAALAATNVNNFNNQAGSMNGLFGLFAGYGMQVGSMYFGGEAFGGFDSAKVTAYDDTATGQLASSFPKAQVKRQNYYGLAARVGGFVNANTLVYVRLAAEAGKWTSSVVVGPNAGGSTAVVGAASKGPFTVNKKSISFAPGLGLETYITKNLFLRAEYSYLFGPSVTVKQDTSVNGSNQGTLATHTFKVTQNAFKVGVGYKF